MPLNNPTGKLWSDKTQIQSLGGSPDTIYTNTSDETIYLYIYIKTSNNGEVILRTGGANAVRAVTHAEEFFTIQGVVPPGATYELQTLSSTSVNFFTRQVLV